MIMYRFRRQHDQLRQVIVRVLRPSTTVATATAPLATTPTVTQQTAEPFNEPFALDTADTNSVDVSSLEGLFIGI